MLKKYVETTTHCKTINYNKCIYFEGHKKTGTFF